MTNDEIARSILDGVSYVVLATADADGAPWSSPVWFATDDYRELFWVSHPGGASLGEHRGPPADRHGGVRLDGQAR